MGQTDYSERMKASLAALLVMYSSALAADTSNLATNNTCIVQASTGECYRIDRTVLRGSWQWPTSTNKADRVAAFKARRYQILEQIADVLRRTNIPNKDPYVQFLLAEDQRIIFALEKEDRDLSPYKELMRIQYPVPIPTDEKPVQQITPRLPEAYRDPERRAPAGPLLPGVPRAPVAPPQERPMPLG